jgi:hypothetical protein
MSNVRTEGLSNPIIPSTESEKFIFFMTPNFLAQDACCGCSLKSGAQIVSLIFLLASISNLFSALRHGTVWSITISGVLFLLYFLSCLMIFYSSMNFNHTYAYSAYLIYASVFLLSVIDAIFMFFLIITNHFKPIDYHYIRGGLAYLVASVVILSIQLYMIWIVYSFAIHLKYKAIHIVSGDLTYKFNPLSQPERITTQTTHV